MFSVATAGEEHLSRRLSAGDGIVECQRQGNCTRVVHMQATAPLKLFAPDLHTPAAWVVAGNFGGGLVSGDALHLAVRLGPGARACLTTQASTKVYVSSGDAPGRQTLTAHVGAGAALVVAPDPVVAFAGARYQQVQRATLEKDASLLLLDWLASGRYGCGERWAFHSFATSFAVAQAGRCVLRDAMLLDGPQTAQAGPGGMGRYNCMGTLYVLGQAFAALAAEALRQVGQSPVLREADLLLAASPHPLGAVVRFACTRTETAGAMVTAFLAGATGILGGQPWPGRW